MPSRLAFIEREREKYDVAPCVHHGASPPRSALAPGDAVDDELAARRARGAARALEGARSTAIAAGPPACRPRRHAAILALVLGPAAPSGGRRGRRARGGGRGDRVQAAQHGTGARARRPRRRRRGGERRPPRRPPARGGAWRPARRRRRRGLCGRALGARPRPPRLTLGGARRAGGGARRGRRRRAEPRRARPARARARAAGGAGRRLGLRAGARVGGPGGARVGPSRRRAARVGCRCARVCCRCVWVCAAGVRCVRDAPPPRPLRRRWCGGRSARAARRSWPPTARATARCDRRPRAWRGYAWVRRRGVCCRRALLAGCHEATTDCGRGVVSPGR
jgi:hypothetical protein